MKVRPILFNQMMTQAILAGTKTMTRRTSGIASFINDRPDRFTATSLMTADTGRAMIGFRYDENPLIIGSTHECPYGEVGDVLWVQETWAKAGHYNKEHVEPAYRASGHQCLCAGWKPSIHMPKEAARIWLEITGIRVERLQAITAADAIAEGIEELQPWPESPDKKRYKMYLPDVWAGQGENAVFDPIASFYSLWIKINGDRSVRNNPWVWVVSFKRIDKPQTDAA